jgi:hypothetical protein
MFDIRVEYDVNLLVTIERTANITPPNKQIRTFDRFGVSGFSIPTSSSDNH